jgi:hypothetical protein
LEDFAVKNLLKSRQPTLGRYTAAHWSGEWQKRRAMHHLAACWQGLTLIGTFYAKSFVDVAITGAAWAGASLAESY